MITIKDVIIRFLISFIVGGVIGIERQLRNKHAGIRTFQILCLASTFLAICSIKLHETIPEVDIGKIILGVVVSLGFIGANVIYKEKNGKLIIYGLTTGVTLLMTAIIGMAIGVGYITEAIISTIFLFLSLIVVRTFEIKSGMKKLSVTTTGVEHEKN